MIRIICKKCKHKIPLISIVWDSKDIQEVKCKCGRVLIDFGVRKRITPKSI